MIIKEYNYGEGYFPKLFIDGNKIVDAKCKCTWAKNNPNAFRNGDKLCWHLTDSIKEYYLEIRNNKKEKVKMLGYNKCPEWLKLAYRKAVKFTCEDCRKHEDKVGTLQPHRIIQGYKGGTYRPGNVKMLCNNCHKKYGEEW